MASLAPPSSFNLTGYQGTDSVLVSLMTSTIVDAPLFRLLIEAKRDERAKLPSQVMVDKSSPCRAKKWRANHV